MADAKPKVKRKGLGRRPLVVDDHSLSVSDVRAIIRERAAVAPGVMCPCCERIVMLRARPLDAGLAKALFWMHHYFQRSDAAPWVHMATWLNEHKANRGNTAALLRFWGLIEERPREPGEVGANGAPTPGFYRLTPQGIAFVTQGTTVPRSILTYGRRFYGFAQDGRTITFREALGKAFDYANVTASPPSPTPPLF